MLCGLAQAAADDAVLALDAAPGDKSASTLLFRAVEQVSGYMSQTGVMKGRQKLLEAAPRLAHAADAVRTTLGNRQPVTAAQAQEFKSAVSGWTRACA